ncbi:MAG: methylmalonyl Co-A mutase-associated GTPase MeaB [Deltaproteobacteria bacterium]|nr:methylmalonyl Co-A mutase-associated GTPase MeaB [Deltaproteobacteria bacterium]
MRLVDDGDPRGLDALAELYPTAKPARIVGVTGSPGTGKSTLVDALIGAFRAKGERVGVIAVDPSSPRTQGAILGDRVRMQGRALDNGVFVRSLASRGQLGGLSASATLTASVLEAMGFGRILLETVGVGQAEVDIARVADSTLLVLAPGLGDDVQAMKAGIMEVADLFVVNKADREGAAETLRDIEVMLRLFPRPESEWQRPVLPTVATRSEGVEWLADSILAHERFLESSGEAELRRASRARLELETALWRAVRSETVKKLGGEAELARVGERVARRETDPVSEARKLLDRLRSE